MRNLCRTIIATSVALACSGPAFAFKFETDNGSIKGSLDSQLTLGMGMRLMGQDCALVGDPGTTCNPSSTANQWTVGDDGNQNYNKGHLFSGYLKGTHELLLQFPDSWKFMARGSWMYDPMATRTERTSINGDAAGLIARNTSLLDLWVSKDFQIADQSARVRVGNQVVSWGESIFVPGGINSTNALNLQKLNVPGTQLKEAVLPAPMVSFASGLGHGMNLEAYYQFGYNTNILPPVGSYFNAGDAFGRGWQNGLVNGGPANAGVQAYEHKPDGNGQYGVSLHFRPESVQADFGFYVMNYHDKMPNVLLNSNGATELEYLKNRQLFGVSTNFNLGNWALGGELSYRPRDAIALAPVGGIACGGGNVCHLSTDGEKYQAHLTAQLQLTPGDYGQFLKLLKADTAYFTAELVGIRYPGVSQGKRYNINGTVYGPSAGGLPWLDGSGGNALSNVTGVQGTANSAGAVVDFNWTYDSTLISGWQVTPGVTVSRGLYGYTPNVLGNFMQGAGSVNFYVLFNQNPSVWQAGINYTRYYGSATAQPLRDRDFIGAFLTRNF